MTDPIPARIFAESAAELKSARFRLRIVEVAPGGSASAPARREIHTKGSAMPKPPVAFPNNKFDDPVLNFETVAATKDIQRCRGKNRAMATWTAYGHGQQSSDPLTDRTRLWYVCDLHFPTSSSAFLLHEIGAQHRKQTVMLRWDFDSVSGVTIKQINGDGTETSPTSVAGYYEILPGGTHDAPPLYMIERGNAPKLVLQCYVKAHPPFPIVANAVPTIQPNDGFPPPGSPGDLD